jgi:hypothetical protein
MPEKKSDALRSRLRNLFVKVLFGSQAITTANAKLFLEAICDQPEPATCIQRLIGNTPGLPSLQLALRFDISLPFLNGPVTDLLLYLQAPELKSICGGAVLQQIILKIVDPPLLWNAFVEAIKFDQLTENCIQGFSWLLLQLVSLPIEHAVAYSSVAQEGQIQNKLLESSRLDVRTRAQRIIHIVDTITTRNEFDEGGPGGRHDNDFADIRKIAILPTPDEVVSKDPFLRRAADVHEYDATSGSLAVHADHHFRLLREDMLRDLREEVHIAIGAKKGRRRGLCIQNLSIADVLCDEHQPWSLQLRCTSDLPELPKKDTASRKRFLAEHKKLLGNQSVACLMADQELVALATLIRENDLLAQDPPVLCLQLSEAAIEKPLLQLRTAKNISVVQLNTAVFAYEPVLQQLKQVKELSLEDDIFHWKQSTDLPTPSYNLSSTIFNVIDSLKKDFSQNLQHVLSLPRPTLLDKSQVACFVAGLRQRLSLIQGPPGTETRPTFGTSRLKYG